MAFRSLAQEELVHLAESSNAGLAQGYVNDVWKRYRDVIVPLAAEPAKLKDNPQVAQFAQDTVRYFQQMPLLRVNVYSTNGTLLLMINVNNNEKLAGANASPDAAFATSHAKSSIMASQVMQDILLEDVRSITLMQTLLPIRNANQVDGVMEVLSDISEPWVGLARFQLYGTGGVIAIFAVFLGILFLTSRRAGKIIARQHEANLELAATAATAQAENRDKSQFLANVSHELRTPLNAIIGFSDVIKNEVMPNVTEKKYHDYISDIHASGVHLLSLINDILDYSKAEAGKLELEVSEINITKMVQNCMRLVSPRAESGQVKLVETLPKEQFTMSTDSKKFKQVLLNLLSNAVKFTPANGEVTVTGWHDPGDDTFTFQVRDTGIGIAPKDISRAMSPFGQVDNTLKRKYEGTGLGLPLTKKFVELMGGKFTIESQVNVGTKISFTLPREIKAQRGAGHQTGMADKLPSWQNVLPFSISPPARAARRSWR